MIEGRSGVHFLLPGGGLTVGFGYSRTYSFELPVVWAISSWLKLLLSCCCAVVVVVGRFLLLSSLFPL